MSAIPVDAIDPEAGYREWVARYLWHVDQLPHVIDYSDSGVLAPVRLKASRTDQIRVSGGGYIDNVPVADGPGARDNRAIWDALRAYLVAAASHLGVEAPILPATVPGDAELARQWAYAANEWLAAIVEHLLDWPDLTALEERLFGLIRRARRRQGGAAVVTTAPLELCETCGAREVQIDWLDGPGGAPVLSRACRVCGET
ncbi:hypothetical protein [Microbacterium sp. NPDC080220]|uniref:hypothetical protein n=1 Tax=Microbacterium sp. NPDC080220 TaxID=3161017 RepID=UPI00342D4F84